jgi:rare lipoprotein A
VPYRPGRLTAAHNSLPFGTRIRVTNVRTGRSVKVVVNDRGPHVKGRVVDVSKRAAAKIGLLDAGVAPVRLRVLRPAPRSNRR